MPLLWAFSAGEHNSAARSPWNYQPAHWQYPADAAADLSESDMRPIWSEMPLPDADKRAVHCYIQMEHVSMLADMLQSS